MSIDFQSGPDDPREGQSEGDHDDTEPGSPSVEAEASDEDSELDKEDLEGESHGDHEDVDLYVNEAMEQSILDLTGEYLCLMKAGRVPQLSLEEIRVLIITTDWLPDSDEDVAFLAGERIRESQNGTEDHELDENECAEDLEGQDGEDDDREDTTTEVTAGTGDILDEDDWESVWRAGGDDIT